jgi:hypothetical protein
VGWPLERLGVHEQVYWDAILCDANFVHNLLQAFDCGCYETMISTDFRTVAFTVPRKWLTEWDRDCFNVPLCKQVLLWVQLQELTVSAVQVQLNSKPTLVFGLKSKMVLSRDQMATNLKCMMKMTARVCCEEFDNFYLSLKPSLKYESTTSEPEVVWRCFDSILQRHLGTDFVGVHSAVGSCSLLQFARDRRYLSHYFNEADFSVSTTKQVIEKNPFAT